MAVALRCLFRRFVLMAVVNIIVIVIMGVFQLSVGMFVSMFSLHLLIMRVSMVAIIVTV